jgi:ElaB/YqjD/DUF883 family membrane-anchored ribosome-binding protein
MKLETTNVMERPTANMREAFDEVEEFGQPLREVSRKTETVASRAQARIRNFPMSAVWTAFAGGLLIGAALGANRPRNLEEALLREPLQRGRRLFFRRWPW